MNNTPKIRIACENALNTFRKINPEEFSEIISKLEFVIGSYDFDKNPIGLYEFGEKALEILKKIKEKNPRKISKKLIEELEEAIKEKN